MLEAGYLTSLIPIRYGLDGRTAVVAREGTASVESGNRVHFGAALFQ